MSSRKRRRESIARSKAFRIPKPWPEVAAVGLCEGAAGPVVAWTSRFILPGVSLPAVSTGSAVRITDLRLTLFDRSGIAQIE